ncbi:TylF/MycF/NovP-related O-methyltransferase [Rhodopseudomonas palustris]|uniref:TylF/MycF/NovP-related O-methyltransferase n=1 Tax=Rhodopseudomonas palustris TaxID=1076 RepID=UPI0018DE258C|nr:TylF/MycF/NovP-related O-methyltransferase [Rhodopseudomonas palustris]
MRDTFRMLQISRLSARGRWLRTYARHIDAEREYLFLCIARFANVNRPIEGYYMEFGCFSAKTMRLAYDSFHHLFDWQYIGFDSFEGLPEIAAIDRQEAWQKGKLATAEENFVRICRRHGIPAEQLRTVKGFYSESLTPRLAQELLPRKAAVIYVDCDLYLSTVPILSFAVDFLQVGTIIVFDDWNCFVADPDRGERRAWREFREAHPRFRFEPFVQTGMQMSFVCVGTSDAAADPAR